MRKRPMGSKGPLVPVVGQGTWNMERDDRASAVAALRRGVDLGMTHIDTAELYGDGEVERRVGEAIAGRRAEVYLVSKVLPHNASRRGTVAACERSLKRLGTDRLDLYLLHWPGEHALEQTFAAFEELLEAGKIGAYGVSNFDENELAEAIEIAGPDRIACNQVLYHLKERSIEQRVLPFCEQHGIALVGYSPFGSDDFPEPRSQGGRVLAEIAARHGVTPHAVALSFLVRHRSSFAIPKASKVGHVQDNAAAGDLGLGAEDVRTLDAAFPLRGRRSGVPML